MRAQLDSVGGASAFIAATIIIASLTVFELTVQLSTTIQLAVAAAVVAAGLAVWRPRFIVAALCGFALLAPFDTLLNVTPGGTVTKYVGLVVFVVALAEIIARRWVVRPPRAVFAWVAYLAWAVTSILWAINPSESASFLTTVCELFALYAIVSLIPFTWAEVKQVMVAAIGGGCLVSAYSYFLAGHAAFAGNAIRLFQGESRTVLRLPGGSESTDPNHVAAALLLPIGLAVAFFLGAPSRLQRLLALASLLVLSIGMYENNSRGGVVALGVMTIYMVFFSSKRWTVATGAAILFGIVTLTHNRIIGRFLHDPGQGSGRGSIWHVAWLAFQDHWLIGVGIANFGSVFDETFLRTRELVYEGWHRPAHSILFSTGVELGVVGLVLMCIVAVQQFRTLRDVPRPQMGFDARTALEGSLLAMGTAALLVDLMHFKYLWLLLIVLGISRNASISDTAVSTVASQTIVEPFLHRWSRRWFAPSE